MNSKKTLAQSTDDARLIRETRTRSNEAIARHDVKAILAEIDATYQGTGGGGGFIQSRALMGKAFAAEFSQIADARYVRTLKTVEIAQSGLNGFETGTWVGTGTTQGGEYRIGGKYAAYWSKKSGCWKIHAEVFVTLFGQ